MISISIDNYLKHPRVRKILKPNIDHDLRPYLANKHLKGSGIEIGALHKPVKVKESVKVRYVDYKSQQDNIKRYPELAGEVIVKTDIVDNGFFLKKIMDYSLDFIVANHFLEHSPDPIGTIETLRQKLRTGGVLYLGVPILEKNYDKGRELTSLKHLVEDNIMFEEKKPDTKKIIEKAKEHLSEFLLISDANIRKENKMKIEIKTKQDAEKEADKIMKKFREEIVTIEKLIFKKLDGTKTPNSYQLLMDAHISKINFIYDIHYHTFSLESYKKLLKFLEVYTSKLKLLDIEESGGGEIIAVVKKIN